MSQSICIEGDLRRGGPLVVTCEHATNHVDAPLVPDDADRPWLDTHWGWDPGAWNVARELITATASVGVSSRFSRLVCDPNRHPDDETWIRTEVEGHPLSFNRNLDRAERERRRRCYHDPYHTAVDAMLHQRLTINRDVWLISVHSFTDCYMGQQRTMEIGVLYDDFEPAAVRLAELLARPSADSGRRAWVTALNEPYSGFDHLMYAANLHGRNHRIHYLELEVRQDLIADADSARRVGRDVADALRELLAEIDGVPAADRLQGAVP